jgi:hypothetical protein
MSIPSVQEPKQTLKYKPDISTLLRIGHFYFALTSWPLELDNQATLSYTLSENHAIAGCSFRIAKNPSRNYGPDHAKEDR